MPATASARNYALLSRQKVLQAAPVVCADPAAIALLCLLASLWVGFFTTRTGSKPGLRTRTSLAVLPFANTDPTSDYLSDGLTSILIDNLSRLPGLAVPAHNSVSLYKDQSHDPPSIGHELNAETILRGTVEQDGEYIAIRIELIDAQTNRPLWSNAYREMSANILSLRLEMVKDVAHELGLTLSLEDCRPLTDGGLIPLFSDDNFYDLYFYDPARHKFVVKFLEEPDRVLREFDNWQQFLAYKLLEVVDSGPSDEALAAAAEVMGFRYTAELLGLLRGMEGLRDSEIKQLEEEFIRACAG